MTKLQKNGNNKVRETSNAIARLLSSVGRNVNLETHDGSAREGKITSFTFRPIVLNGVSADLPTKIELNGDIMDTIPISSISKLDIQ
jgi:hypothetical protein